MILGKLFAINRHGIVAKALVHRILHWGNGLVALIIFLATGFYSAYKSISAVWIPFGVLAIMLFGYYFIYIITPENQQWHLDTSLGRLLLHLWPALLFLTFMVVKPFFKRFTTK